MTAVRVVEQLQSKRPGADPVIAMQRGSVLVLETAYVAGLPAPVEIFIDDQEVAYTLRNEDDLNAWSIWLQAEVTPYPINRRGTSVYYCGRAVRFDVPVVIGWTEIPS
jgi:hypothetical protein